MQPLEHISVKKSCKAILAGLSICIFTPNRIGEFAGRIYYLTQADKIKATLLTFIGNMYQLLCTVVIGITALIVWCYTNGEFSWLTLERALYLAAAFIGSMLVGLLLYKLVIKNSIKIAPQIAHYIFVFKALSIPVHLVTLLLSLGRYFIFSLQFYLLLRWLAVDITILQGMLLIPITFFVIAVIPTFALSELSVRGASAIYILGVVSLNTTGILAASLLLWIINLAIPALIGLIFVFDLKFFKSDQ
jgi:uncharacterized membrane protein YbhN (UPF0104 family)